MLWSLLETADLSVACESMYNSFLYFSIINRPVYDPWDVEVTVNTSLLAKL